jgi:hypothetical protein
MKLSSAIPIATTAAAAVLLLSSCSSLENPFSGWFHHNTHDERVYNPQTGEWEWPPDKRAAHARETPAPQGSDTRYWDAQHNQWVEKTGERSGGAGSAREKPSSGAAAPPIAPGTPRPSRQTGVYNASTGKIEWQDGAYVPSIQPPPAPKKHWWWPFGGGDHPASAANTPAPAEKKHSWWPFGGGDHAASAANTATPVEKKHWWWPF